MGSTLVTRRLSSSALLAALLGVAGGAGCMTKQQAAAMRTGQGEAMPVIDVRPGVASRIAWMDEVRLHDETRKHMMRRPHVTIEEVPPDEQAKAEAEEEEKAEEAEPEASEAR